MWMIAGFAGGIQPWWHHIGAYHEDRRMYRTAEPVMRWCKANERVPGRTARRSRRWASCGRSGTPISSAATTPTELVDAPYTGFMHALVRARIPYLPVHADHIEREARRSRVLVLPERGRAVGRAGRRDPALRRARRRRSSRPARPACTTSGATRARTSRWPTSLRVTARATRRGSRPERWRGRHGRGGVRPDPAPHLPAPHCPSCARGSTGPKPATNRPSTGERHPVLRGFDETDILPYGGTLEPLRIDAGRDGPLTFVPPFPIYPPETAWMRAAEDRHPGPGPVAARPRRAWPTCPPTSTAATRATTCPTTATCSPTWSAGRPTRRMPLEVDGPGPDRLPPLRAARPADPAPGEPDQRGDVARADRRTDPRGPVHGEGPRAASAGQAGGPPARGGHRTADQGRGRRGGRRNRLHPGSARVIVIE